MPENLTARANKGVVNLAWTDTNNGETGYEVLRSVSGSPTHLTTLAANSTRYTDSSVEKGVTYQYQVRAILNSTAGPLSSIVSVTVR
jgi:hypothetical protein